MGDVIGPVVADLMAGRVASLRTLVVLTALGGLGVFTDAGTSSLPVVVLPRACCWGTVLEVLVPLRRTMLHLHTRLHLHDPRGPRGPDFGRFLVHHAVRALLRLAAEPDPERGVTERLGDVDTRTATALPCRLRRLGKGRLADGIRDVRP